MTNLDDKKSEVFLKLVESQNALCDAFRGHDNTNKLFSSFENLRNEIYAEFEKLESK